MGAMTTSRSSVRLRAGGARRTLVVGKLVNLTNNVLSFYKRTGEVAVISPKEPNVDEDGVLNLTLDPDTYYVVDQTEFWNRMIPEDRQVKPVPYGKGSKGQQIHRLFSEALNLNVTVADKDSVEIGEIIDW